MKPGDMGVYDVPYERVKTIDGLEAHLFIMRSFITIQGVRYYGDWE